MLEFIAGRGIWDEVPKFGPTDRVSAAVSYVGAGADSLVWLGAGDRLVFDGSDAALGAGLVNPAVIERWHQDGVELRRLDGLHAKVLVVEHARGRGLARAYVGSMNLSHHSNTSLDEAAVTTDEQVAVEGVLRWVDELLARGKPVTEDWLDHAKKKYRQWPVPRPAAPAGEFIDVSGRVFLVTLPPAYHRIPPDVRDAAAQVAVTAGDLFVEALEVSVGGNERVGDVLVAFPATNPETPLHGNTRIAGVGVIRRTFVSRRRHYDVVVWASSQQVTRRARFSEVRDLLGIRWPWDTDQVAPERVPELFELLGVQSQGGDGVP